MYTHILVSVMVQGQKCVIVKATVVSSISLGALKYLIFSFLRSSTMAKRTVEFHHSTRNASIIRRKIENRSILMRNGVSYTVKTTYSVSF